MIKYEEENTLLNVHIDLLHVADKKFPFATYHCECPFYVYI